jgi:hypothetical protein
MVRRTRHSRSIFFVFAALVVSLMWLLRSWSLSPRTGPWPWPSALPSGFCFWLWPSPPRGGSLPSRKRLVTVTNQPSYPLARIWAGRMWLVPLTNRLLALSLLVLVRAQLVVACSYLPAGLGGDGCWFVLCLSCRLAAPVVCALLYPLYTAAGCWRFSSVAAFLVPASWPTVTRIRSHTWCVHTWCVHTR